VTGANEGAGIVGLRRRAVAFGPRPSPRTHGEGVPDQLRSTSLVLRTRRSTRASPATASTTVFRGIFGVRLPKRPAIALRTSVCTSSRMTVMMLLRRGIPQRTGRCHSTVRPLDRQSNGPPEPAARERVSRPCAGPVRVLGGMVAGSDVAPVSWTPNPFEERGLRRMACAHSTPAPAARLSGLPPIG
jgi:hypothetical protein